MVRSLISTGTWGFPESPGEAPVLGRGPRVRQGVHHVIMSALLGSSCLLTRMAQKC